MQQQKISYARAFGGKTAFQLQIKSDLEIESHINDRESFQTFLGLSSTEATPDHSTFSKFRKRLTKGKFDLIVGDILNQFAAQGLTINEGIAIDARIVNPVVA